MQLGQVYADQWKKNLGVTVGWVPTPTQVFNKDSTLGNYGRWANETMFTDTKALSSIKVDDLDKIKPLAQEMQKAIAEDAPFIPAMTSTTPILWSSRKWTGFPEPGTTKFIPSGAIALNSSIDTFLMLKPAS